MSVHAIVEDLETARRAVASGASVLRLVPGAARAASAKGAFDLRAFGTTFFVVDDVEVALELGADGVHLVSRPELAEPARRAGLQIGAATRSDNGAFPDGVDYLDVECGPGGGDKDGASAWLSELARACAAASAPVIVSGARAAGNAAVFIAAGAAGVAITGAPPDRALRRVVDQALAARRAQR